MTKAVAAPTYNTPSNQFTHLFLGMIWLWQLLLGIAGLGIAGRLLFRPIVIDAPQVLLVVFANIFVGLALASFASIPLLQQRNHRGRVIVLAVNYLCFLGALLYASHRLGVFTGIDNLATTFGRSVPFLIAAVGGWLVAAQADRYPNHPQRARQFQQVGWALMALFGLLALLAMDPLSAAQALFGRLISDSAAASATLATLIFGFVTWILWHEQAGRYFNAKVSHSEMLNGYLLLSPNLLGFLIFFAGPLVFSLYVSFTEWSAFGEPQWIGLQNYQEILGLTMTTLQSPGQLGSAVLPPTHQELTRFGFFGQNVVIGARDTLFWIAIRNTLFYCLMVVPLSIIPALVLSNILNSKVPGMRFFRTIYFLPSIAAVVGVAVIWSWLYNSTTGFINYGISGLIGFLNILPGVAIEDPRLTWLSSSTLALPALALMAAWRIVGFNTVLFLAGLQGISTEIYEAADVDGAGTWEKFRSITIPLLAPTTFFVVTTTIIQALQVFDEVFVMMNPPQGPSNSTLTAVLYLYQNGFQRFKLGYASAVAWVLFLLIFLVTIIQLRIQRSGDST